jgi:hypothetical protein
MGYLSGTIVILGCVLSVNYLQNIFYIRGICEDSKENEIYKEISVYVTIFAFILVFAISIFGYINNCTFLLMKSRISGVQQFISYLFVLLLINILLQDKKLYKLKKKFKYKRYLLTTFSIVSFLVLTTLIITFLNNDIKL